MYFGYIFDFENVENTKNKLMLEKCEKQSLKYCFFDPKQSLLCDKNGQEINDINDIVSKVFVDTTVKQINNLDSLVYTTVKFEDENSDLIVLNNSQSKALTSLVKKIYGPLYNWKYIQKSIVDKFISDYLGNNKYFYMIYNFPHFKAVFFKPYKIYNLLFFGDIIEDTVVDYKNCIFICEIINEKK